MVEHPFQARSKSECPTPSPSVLSTHSQSGSHPQSTPDSRTQAPSHSRSPLTPQPTTRSTTPSDLDDLAQGFGELSVEASTDTVLPHATPQHERAHQQQNPHPTQGQNTSSNNSREERLAREQQALLGKVDKKVFDAKYGYIIRTKTNPTPADSEEFCMYHGDKNTCPDGCRYRSSVEKSYPNPGDYK